MSINPHNCGAHEPTFLKSERVQLSEVLTEIDSREAKVVLRLFIFLFCVMPLELLFGVGVDYLRVSKGTAALGAIIRRAANVAGYDPNAARAYVASNSNGEFVGNVSVSFERSDGGPITCIAIGKVATPTMGFFGFPEIRVTASATVNM